MVHTALFVPQLRELGTYSYKNNSLGRDGTYSFILISVKRIRNIQLQNKNNSAWGNMIHLKKIRYIQLEK